MKIRITILLDLDLKGLSEEYGDTFSAKEAREFVRQGIIEALINKPYRDAIKDWEVR